LKASSGLAALGPSGVVTVTSTPPAPAGEIAEIEVADSTLKLVAFAAPNLTAVAPARFVPVMVTLVPPDGGPSVGLNAVTVGRNGPTARLCTEPASIPVT